EFKNDKLYVTEEISDHWREASNWTSKIAVIGYLLIGVIVMFLVYISRLSGNIEPIVWLFALVITLIVYSASRNLYRYSVQIQKAANESEWEAMETAFSSLKTAYIIYGFFTLLGAIIIVLAIGYYAINMLPLISNNF
ncbi:MAG: hypothetical protein Q8K92_26540, partial [Leadbetterella sp.]|nr:hypothetical protein [Leadbetterella sp.]